jgi:hypothetical protein
MGKCVMEDLRLTRRARDYRYRSHLGAVILMMDEDHPMFASFLPPPAPPDGPKVMCIVNHQGAQEHTTIIAADMTHNGRVGREIDAAVARRLLTCPTTRPPIGSARGVYAWHLWPGPTLNDIDFVAAGDPIGAAEMRERAGPNRAAVASTKRNRLGELRAIESKAGRRPPQRPFSPPSLPLPPHQPNQSAPVFLCAPEEF